MKKYIDDFYGFEPNKAEFDSIKKMAAEFREDSEWSHAFKEEILRLLNLHCRRLLIRAKRH